MISNIIISFVSSGDVDKRMRGMGDMWMNLFCAHWLHPIPTHLQLISGTLLCKSRYKPFVMDFNYSFFTVTPNKSNIKRSKSVHLTVNMIIQMDATYIYQTSYTLNNGNNSPRNKMKTMIGV